MLEDGQAIGVELVGLVNVPHHLLGHLGVSQERDTSGLLDLIDDPVPVADGFQGNWCFLWEPGEKGTDGPGLMVDASPLDGLASMIDNGEERIVLVRVASDPIMRLLQHAAPPVHWLSRIHQCSGRCSAFI